MTPRQWILQARKNDANALRDGIFSLYNCREVEVTGRGQIWIADPMRGHWLDSADLAHVARAIAAGDI